jgi:hypothetical protein
MTKTILDDWTFQTEEVSANVYTVRGVDKSGRSVESIGIDPEKLLEACKISAEQMMQKEVQRQQKI